MDRITLPFTDMLEPACNPLDTDNPASKMASPRTDWVARISTGPEAVEEERNAVEHTEQTDPQFMQLRMDALEPKLMSRKTDTKPPILAAATVEIDDPNRAVPFVDSSAPMNPDPVTEAVPRVVTASAWIPSFTLRVLLIEAGDPILQIPYTDMLDPLKDRSLIETMP